MWLMHLKLIIDDFWRAINYTKCLYCYILTHTFSRHYKRSSTPRLSSENNIIIHNIIRYTRTNNLTGSTIFRMLYTLQEDV